MNAGVAWTLLGLTIRLAQTHGLHSATPAPTVPSTSKNLRTDIWWQIIWQESLLSIVYDRASSTETINYQHPVSYISLDRLSYIECMRSLCKISLGIVKDRSLTHDTHNQLLRIMDYLDKINGILDRSADHLRDARSCRSIKDQLEHWNLLLHRSYITSELCRPTVMPNVSHLDLASTLRETCIKSLADTVDAFLGLHNITKFANQSWAAVHRALSSALLLGILREPSRSDRVRQLLDRLIFVVSSLASDVDPIELSAPITRSLQALRKLNSSELSAQSSVGDMSLRLSTGLESELPESTPVSTATLASLSPSFLYESPEGSPYTLRDSILWGRVRFPSI